jgi:glutamine amidotransferase
MSLCDAPTSRTAIVDYGMGNLFSVQRACEQIGLQAVITSSPEEVMAAQAIILPGVGAFGDAMATLRRQGLAEALQAAAGAGKPLFGICLGMQLLMTHSYEFGCHQGLGILDGEVVRFESPRAGETVLKVPQVGWNRIFKAPSQSWEGTPLEGIPDSSWMYFVHSFYVKPVDAQVVCAVARYGHIELCASLRRGHVFACQFHPERSGLLGLAIYRQFAAQVLSQEVSRV